MTTSNSQSAVIGYTVSKQMSYTETAYVSHPSGMQRTNEERLAWVFTSELDAMVIACHQASLAWTVKPVVQQW